MTPLNLLSLYDFGILSYAGITSTGGGTVGGDAGASPITGAAIGLTSAQVTGTIYTVDAAGPAGSVQDKPRVDQGILDLTTAYNEAAGRTPIPTGTFLNPVAASSEMGGQTLTPGLYKFTSTAAI